MSVQARSRRLFNFQGRSFLAFVLTPVAPVQDWLLELEDWVAKTPEFFSKKPLILDLSKVPFARDEFAAFLVALRRHDLRLISIEGIEAGWVEPGLEPLEGGKWAGETGAEPSGAEEIRPEEISLMLKTPVRSGQSIFFPRGDITVAGSVSSGAEVISGGSVHVYGVLRGRAFAGAAGNLQARIFCQRFEAELLVIGGIYKSSEHFDPDFFGKPVQAWREGQTLKLKVME